MIFVLLIICSTPSVALAENKEKQRKATSAGADTLTILSSELLPFAALRDGQPVGFAVEILHEIMQRLERSDNIEFDEWDIVYNRTLNQPNTVLMPPSRTQEREKLFKWVGPLVPEKIVLFARKDSRLVIKSLDDAKKVGGIATVTGYASEKLLKEMGFENLVSQRSSLQGPDALKFGRVDLWFNSNITMKKTALAANVDPDLFEPVFVVKEIPSYLAFSKSVSDELVNQWQDTLDDMKQDGTWERIVSGWIPADMLRIGSAPLDLTEEERIWIESNPTVKVVHYFHQPPFTIDTDHSHTGYLYELLFEVLRQTGLRAKFVEGYSSYDSMIEALENGKVDILTNLNSTRRLEDSIDRTVPVVKSPYVVVSKIRVPEITHTSDLFGKKVAVVKGFAQDAHLSKFPQILKVHVKNNKEGFEAVRMDKAEYFLNNMANSNYVLQKSFATDLRIAGTLSYEDFPPLTLSFGVHGKDSPLPGIIHKALAAIPISTLSQLRESWLANEINTKKTMQINLTPKEQAFIKEHPVILIGGPRAFPPFQFMGKDNEFQGMAIDYIKLIAKKAGFEVKAVKNLPWPKLLYKMENKELDLITSVSITPERQKIMRFSTPYLSFPLVIISRENTSFISGLEDLRNKKVAFINKSALYEYMKRESIEMAPVFADTPLEALNMVSLGKAEATIRNLAASVYLMKKHNLVNLKIAAPTNYGNQNLAFGVREDWPELVSILNKAIKTIDHETHDNIQNKWISVKYEYGMNRSDVIKWILIVLGVASVIVIATIFWNRSLATEIEERKKVAAILRESEERYRTLFTNEIYAIIIFEIETRRFIDVNEAFLKMYGYTREEALGLTSEDVSAEVESTKEAIKKSAVDGTVFIPLRRHKKKDGTVFFVELSAGPFTWKGKNLMYSILHDITERKETDEALKQSLDDKDILIKEIHHRVKNNLAVIQSLLSLQTHEIKDEDAKVKFRESQNRIKSMSMIHERLYSTDDLTSINVSEYVESLATQLFENYKLTKSRVDLIFNVSDVKLDINTIIPCGLIINELISNACKYAFPDDIEGKLEIEFSEGHDNEYILVVKDNGIGIPKDFDIFNTTSLGMQIVTSLMTQINGKLEVIRNGGTEFRITFKEKSFNQ